MTKVILETEHPVALDSPDHLCPWGTKQDNSTNPNFNRKLYRLFSETRPMLRILDLGCSGGGFVRSCVDDGHFAIGLEGSDYSQKTRRAEWRSIPERLFTCDISRPFQLWHEDGASRVPLQFDVITMWEVIEHIAEAALPTLASNVARHLMPGGLWVLSVSVVEDIIQGSRLHQTVHPRTWWLGRLEALGFVTCLEHLKYFNTQFVRGPKNYASASFNLVLAKANDNALPLAPGLPLSEFLVDRWCGCRVQRILRSLVMGQRYR